MTMNAAVVPCNADGPAKHFLCIPCFEEQIAVALDDADAVCSDRVRCVCPVSDDDGGLNCDGGRTVADALRFTKSRHQELEAKHSEMVKKQMFALRDEIQCRKSEESEVEAASGIRPPSYWSLKDSAADWRERFRKGPLSVHAFLVRIDQIDHVWDIVERMLNGSCLSRRLGRGRDQVVAGRYDKLKVKELHRVENPFLWMRYQSTIFSVRMMQQMHGLSPMSCFTVCEDDEVSVRAGLRSDVNEKYLFHGTSAPNALLVAETGFNERFSKDGLCECAARAMLPNAMLDDQSH